MTAQQTILNTPAKNATRAGARVWILQPEVQHYRLPVFDGVQARGRADGAYEIAVFGGLDAKGECIGGGTREYVRSLPLQQGKILGVPTAWWPGFEQLLRHEKPDALVMLGNPRMRQCWTLPTLARSMGIPVIAWSKVHSYSRLAWISNVLKPRFFKRFDRVIVYGESARKELVALGIADSHIFVAQNTIDTRRIFTDADRITKRGEELRKGAGLTGRRLLLCIGRMDAEKRHQDLLDAWPRLKAIDPDLSLVIVSGGPLLEEIRAKARAIDPAGILVTGRVPEGDDYAWISTCDIGIYPGAVGLAINISLAFGKPTIIADERGSDSEILEHGATGWRYARGDLDGMIACVKNVIDDPPASRAVCDRARTLMRDTVTIDNMVSKIDSAIRVAVSMRTGKHPRP
jgi:glycosyltransferase involved in cell wall biosynthesis